MLAANSEQASQVSSRVQHINDDGHVRIPQFMRRAHEGGAVEVMGQYHMHLSEPLLQEPPAKTRAKAVDGSPKAHEHKLPSSKSRQELAVGLVHNGFDNRLGDPCIRPGDLLEPAKLPRFKGHLPIREQDRALDAQALAK